MREAAGYILFQGRGEDRLFLLLRSARHGTWAFPKGHLEPGEDARAGARRELYEETGIQVIYELRDFEATVRYAVPAGSREEGGAPYEKRVRYLLAEAPSREWTRSAEHDDGAWFPVEEVLARLAHEDLKSAFRLALERIDRPGHRR